MNMILTQPDAEVAAWEQMTGTSIQTINLIPTMKPIEYLATVVNTCAALGHRGVLEFELAFTDAQECMRARYSEELQKAMAQRVRDRLVAGQARYVPGARYFDASTAVEYAALVAKFNSVS